MSLRRKSNPKEELLSKAANLVGKKGFAFDSRIPGPYLFGVCARYSRMLARGLIRGKVIGRTSAPCFIGKKVTIRNGRQLFLGKNAQIRDGALIDALSIEGVHIGERSIIGENSRIECTGSLRDLGKGFYLGDRSSFGSDCFFGSAGGISIGDDVIAGQCIRFHSENHVYSDPHKLIKDQGITRSGISVGNNCWIGAGAVFLDGSSVGDGCVIAANAVVVGQFPDNVIIGGVPAKVLKERPGCSS